MGKITPSLESFLSNSWSFLKNRLKRLDKLLLLLCMALSAFSVYMLRTMVQNGINPGVIDSRTWKVQLGSAVVGVILALVISSIDYKLISKIWFTYAPVAIFLSLLLFTSLGRSTEGSNEVNWLNLGFIQIQPSEFMTAAFIMTFSTHLSKVGENLNRLHNILLLCMHALVPIGLMILQKNTGGPLILLFIFLFMIFMAGVSWKYLAAGAVATPIAGYMFWNYYAKDYHKMRILVVINKDIQQQEYRGYFHQQHQSLMAMSTGGLTGQGLTGGDYISIFAIHNDFIFAYIGMTLGFVGCILTLLGILFVCIRLLTVMSVAKDPLGKAICSGAFAAIFFHTVINVGMVTAVSPVVGVPLPFVSSGGSSTLCLYIIVGLAMSVWAHREKPYHMFYEE